MSSEKWTVRNSKADAVRGDRGLILDSQDANNNKLMNVEDISRLQSAANTFDINTPYKINDFVQESSLLYVCITAVAGSGAAFNVSEWRLIEVGTPFHILEDYSDSATYVLDELVNFNGTFYKNTTPVTVAETFNILNWIEVNGSNAVINVREVADFPDALTASFTTVENNGGNPQFVFTVPHGYSNKQTVLIENSTDSSYNGFNIITVISTTKFSILSLSFNMTATGDCTRCLNPNTHYKIGVPITTLFGYRRVDNSSLIITSENNFVNKIQMIGGNTTFLTFRGTGFVQLFATTIEDLSETFPTPTTNQFLDVIGPNVATAFGFLIIKDCDIDFFGKLGNVDEFPFVIRESGVLFYNEGFTCQNSLVTNNNILVFTFTPSTYLTLNNTTPNLPGSNFNTITPNLPAGVNLLNIAPSMDETNKVNITDSASTLGGNYFKPGTEALGDITAFSGTVGLNPVNVTSTDIGADLGSQVFINITKSTNFNGEFETTFVDADTVSIVVPGGFVAGGITTGKWEQVRIITNLTAGAANAGTISTIVSNGKGGVTVTANTGTSLEEGASMTLTGTTFYNGTFRAFDVGNGVFDIHEPHTFDDSGGFWSENKINLEIFNHGLTLGVPVLIDKTPNNDGPSSIQTIVSTNNVEISGVFVASTTQGLLLDGSLTQSAKNVLLNTVSGELNSKAKGSFSVDGNTQLTVLTLNTFVDLSLHPGGSPQLVVESQDTELFKLTDPLTGELEYIGLEPFSGQLISSLVFDGGNNKVLTFRAVKNGGAMVDRTTKTITGQNNQSTLTFVVSVTAVTNDKFRLQIDNTTDSTDITIIADTTVIQ